MLALGVLLIVLAGVGTIAASTVVGSDDPAPRVPSQLVEPRPGDNVFWPYTSRTRSVGGQTLAINVVVHGDADRLQFHLTERPGANWNETDEQTEDTEHDQFGTFAEDGANATVVDWASARGAKRFLYVHNYALTAEGPNQTTRRPYQAAPYIRDESDGTDPGTVGGEWIDESYQLHDGTYFGTRFHLRVYESPFDSDEWIAIQAHGDHWDWFRLRHTVHGTESAQNRLESEFMGRPFVEEVWRMYLHNGGSASDGWATVIDLRGPPSRPAAVSPTAAGSAAESPAGAESRSDIQSDADAASGPLARSSTPLGGGLFVAGIVAAVTGAARLRSDASGRRGENEQSPVRPADGPSVASGGIRSRWASALLERFDQRQVVAIFRTVTYASLFASVFLLYLSVRAGGILLETGFPGLSPKAIAASLYPFVAIGLPLCAYAFARTVDPVEAFALAAAGLEAAIVADYLYLGIGVLEIEVVVHRIGIAVAVGLIAAGALPKRSDRPAVNQWLAAGVLLWAFLLVAPLVGWL